MAGVAKHPNEYTLTRWYVAALLNRANDDDLSWIATEMGSFKRNLWRYKAGRRALMWRNPGGELARLDERFPGSSAIFRSPFGQILMGAKLSKSELERAIIEIGDPCRAILLAGGYTSTSENRRSRNIDELFAELELFPDLHTIAAIVFMLSWADRVGNHDTWNAVCRFYRSMIPRFVVIGHLKHHEIVFDALDEFAKFRNFAANARHDCRLSWRREIPRIKKQRKKVAREIMVTWEKLLRMFYGESSISVPPEVREIPLLQ